MSRRFIPENSRNITKADLVQHLAEELKDLTQAQCKLIVEMYFEIISQRLEDGLPVRINGLGTFDVRHKGERPGRNVRTGEEVTIEARRVVTFHPSPTLRDRVSEKLLDDAERPIRK